jgi:zinc protease
VHPPPRTPEPAQLGERRVTVEREGTTAYLKAAFHAPAIGDDDFVPLLVLDAVLAGAKGLNLWSSFRTPPPQRSARLYRTLVEGRLASAVSGTLLPTADPFLYTLSLTATEGTSLQRLEEALAAELDRVRAEGITASELDKARKQLRARLVFENDGVTNIAHQVGFFETIASASAIFGMADRIARVTADDVGRAAACLRPANRTIGWFDPVSTAGS